MRQHVLRAEKGRSFYLSGTVEDWLGELASCTMGSAQEVDTICQNSVVQAPTGTDLKLIDRPVIAQCCAKETVRRGWLLLQERTFRRL
jgi:hypothetical protein